MSVSHGNQPLIGYENQLRGATVVSDDAQSGFPVSQLTDGRTATQAGFAAGAGQVVYDLGGARTLDYAALCRHNLADEGATLTLEHASSDSGPWTTLVTFLPSTGAPVLSQYTSVSDRYVRATISGHSNAVYIGDLAVGAVAELPAAMPPNWTSPRYNRQDKLRPTRSRAGQLVGLSREEKPRQSDIRLRSVSPSWFDTHWEALEEVLLQYPVYFVWDADNRPGEVMYCWLRGQAPTAPYNTAGKYQDTTIEVEGIIA